MTQTATIVSLKEIVEQRPLVTVGHDASVAEAARAMKANKRGAVLVVDKDRMRGIFTERDLVNRVVAEGLDPLTTKMSQVMSQELIVTSSQSYVGALSKMAAANVRHLPVVEGDRVIGIVSRRELLLHDVKALEELLDRRDPSSLFI